MKPQVRRACHQLSSEKYRTQRRSQAAALQRLHPAEIADCHNIGVAQSRQVREAAAETIRGTGTAVAQNRESYRVTANQVTYLPHPL